MILAGAHKTFLATLWFAAFGLMTVALLFHPLPMAARAVVIYMVLPTAAAAASGGLWGRVILDRAKTSTLGQSLLRGIAVAGGAFAIFAVLFALALPLVERGWSLRQASGLLLLTSTLGLLFAGPAILVGGMLAGSTLYLFGRKAVGPISQ